MKLIQGKKAALELSVGTIVVIVLSVTMLILGLILINEIFIGGTDAVESINQEVLNKISETFSSDSNSKVVVYPPSRKITIRKGNTNDLGFAFSIRNTGVEEGKFTYTVTALSSDLRASCGVTEAEVESWVIAGKDGSVTLPPGSKMDLPEFVRFRIPDNAPPCLVRYGLDVKKDGQQYAPTVSVDVDVKSA